MEKRKAVTAIALAAILVLAGCATTPAGGQASAEAAVRAIFATYAGSLKTGDADAWMALWDEEGVQLPFDEPMHVGKAAIREANYEGLKSLRFDMTIDTQEVIDAGDYAFARGLYRYTGRPAAGGDSFSVDGKFLTVFKRQPDGGWKIFRDSFNSNVPSR